MAADPMNELVMSNEEMAAEINSTDDGADPVVEEDLTSDEPLWGSEGDDASTDAEATDPAQETPAQTVRKYTANGREVEVDHADTARVDQLITLGLGARQVFSERDKLRRTVGQKDRELEDLRKYKSLWDKIEASKHDRAGLYEKIFGEPWQAALDRELSRKQAWEAATPEERRILEHQQKLEEMQRKMEERERLYEEQTRKAEETSKQAAIRETRAKFLPEFHKHEFSQKVADPEEAEELNAILWTTTVRNLKKAYADQDDIPSEAIRREFERVARRLGGNAKEAASKEVKKVVEEKKATAKTQAQAASTRNYRSDAEEARELAKRAKDPVGLLQYMYDKAKRR